MHSKATTERALFRLRVSDRSSKSVSAQRTAYNGQERAFRPRGVLRGELISDDFERYELRISDNDRLGEGVYREVDLSQCKTARFSFDYRRDGFDRSSDYVTVSASNDGGQSWKELEVIEGPGSDDQLITAQHDFADFLSEGTQIRFLTSDSLGGRDYLYIDNVEITCN